METDIQNIPDYVFDWMQDYSFDCLGSAKQAEVLQYFTAGIYNDMHEAIHDVKQSRNQISKIRKNTIKQNLLQEFDALHAVAPLKSNLLFYPVALWKVAATLVFLASAALWLSKVKPVSSERNLIAQADTVYITKQVLMEPQKIYDTVFISEKSQPKIITKTPRLVYENSTENNPSTSALLQHTEFVFGIDALHNKANLVKKNSMSNDSLGNDFSFVTL